MSIDPVKIPQNVYVEDRIVGPLTLRQLLMIAVGGGFSYMLYGTIAKANGGHLGIVPTVLLWIPCAISVLFALVKINDLSLFRIVFLAVEKINKPPVRTWGPRQGLSIHIRTGGAQEVEKMEKARQEEQKRMEEAAKTGHRIRELSSVLDRPIDPLPDNVTNTMTEPQAAAPAPSATQDTDAPAPRFPVDKNRVQATPLAGDTLNDLLAPTETQAATPDPAKPDAPAAPSFLTDNPPTTPPDLSAYRGVFRDISPQP